MGDMEDNQHRGLEQDASQRLNRLREDIRAAALTGNSVLAAKLTMAYANAAADQLEPTEQSHTG